MGVKTDKEKGGNQGTIKNGTENGNNNGKQVGENQKNKGDDTKVVTMKRTKDRGN